jgi:uncharacterized protein (TIGR03067 family)
MRKTGMVYAVALVVGGGLVGCDSQSDKDGLQGNWVLTGISANGKANPVNAGANVVFTFSGEKLLTNEPGKPVEESSFQIDPNHSPKHINLSKDKDKDEGIYALDGDTLKIGFMFSPGTPGKPSGRPTGFDANNVMTLSFKREKK